MPRIPIPSGSRVAVVNVPDDAIVLRPPAPSEAIADVGAAVRDALRFPLSGAPLEALVTVGGKATIVVEPPELPLPGAPNDPRRAALAAAIAELERLGVPSRQQTILVAGGLNRRAGQRELEALVAPASARRFHGRVEVHDAEAPDLVHLADAGRTPLRVNRLVAETDLVVCVTAAETVLHGGPGALLGACGPETLRASTAYSLLETAAARGWQLGLALERSLTARVPVIGASLVLNPPRLLGPLPRLPVRGRVARAARDLPAATVLAPPLRAAPPHPSGPRARAHRRRSLCGPTVGRARGGAPARDRAPLDPARATARRDRDRDALEAPSLAAGTAEPAHGRDRRAWPCAAALARRLPRRGRRHRDRAPPTDAPLCPRDAGSVPLALPRAPGGPDERRARVRRAGGGERRAHLSSPTAPAEPATLSFRTSTGRAAGRRSTGSALSSSPAAATTRPRATLGFVPTHGISSALEMAHGRAGGSARMGLLLGPPYFPLEVAT